jgi:hypothetical protein
MIFILAYILPGALLILLIIMLGWRRASVFLNYLWGSVCYRHLVVLILLFLIRSDVPLVYKVAVFEFAKEPWPGLNYTFIQHPLGCNIVGVLCGRILQRPLEGWDACIVPRDNILIVFVLLGRPLITPLVLSPEMVLPYACIQEVLRSLAMWTVISGEIVFLVEVIIQLQKFSMRHDWIMMHVVQIFIWELLFRL